MAKKEGKELTPMMKQFFDFKAKYPEAVLLFRCGDFYETYCEDAVIASQILGITPPAHEVVNGHLRTVGIVNLQTVALLFQLVADDAEAVGGLAGEQPYLQRTWLVAQRLERQP